jgi:alpha-tubulin suppressor-like RCC1 family protein
VQLTPVQVTGLTGVTKIAAGERFSLALRSDGTVWAWRDNSDGELGAGRIAGSNIPVRVQGLSQVTRIAAGADSALAVRTGAGITSLWAWGLDVGSSPPAPRLLPVQVTGILAPAIADVSAGNGFVVVLGTDGSVWAWGGDGYGQLGIGPIFGPPLAQPVEPIKPGSGIIQIAAGEMHVLALRSNGTVLAWAGTRPASSAMASAARPVDRCRSPA